MQQSLKKKKNRSTRPTFFRSTPIEREKAAVLACGGLHIPPTTILKFNLGNTVDGIRRHYVECAGFRLSNAFPDNIVELTSGDVVIIEKFVTHTPSDTLFILGRQFLNVSI